MKRIIIIWAIFMFSFIAAALAETSIKAEVDKQGISMDETLTYKIVISSSDKKIPAPEAPKFEGFQVVSQAQSSTVSFAKSKIKSIQVYVFILAPSNIGKFKIGPSSIKIKNRVYSSDEFEIEVTPGKNIPNAPQEEKPLPPKETQPELEGSQVTL